MLAQEQLQRTPLYDEHVALNARMVPFGGWEMPVQYGGIINEHKATRTSAAIFDISHMGEFIIDGDYAKSGLDRIVTMRLRDLPINSCRYGCMANEQGGVIDDLIVFRLAKEKWFLVVNGATTQKDAEHIQKHLTRQAAFSDISLNTGKIDIQGPRSREILKEHVDGIEQLKYYSFGHFDLLGERVLISRTGYTGELGYEIYSPWNKTKELWNTLLTHDNVNPAGLGARDILRLEAGYSLYGHELNDDVSPLQSGLDRFIDFEKDFIGKDFLSKEKASGIKRKIVGLKSGSRRSPREGHRIFSPSNEEIGIVTSGTFSPCLNVGIGLGFVDAKHALNGNSILFGDAKGKNSAAISPKAFYKSDSLLS